MQDKGSALVAELTRGDPGGLTHTPNRTVKFRPVKFRAAGDVQIRAAACKHWREPEQALPCTP